MRYRIIDGALVRVVAADGAVPREFSRRRFLEASFLAVGAMALSACGDWSDCEPGESCGSGGG